MTEVAEPKKATAGFVISLIAGIIILINALLIAGIAGVVGSWAEWVPEAEEEADVISTFFYAWAGAGLIFSILVIIGAILIYMPGKEVLGGIMVLVFSILSIIIGGGFLIGLILGIVGGILGIVKK